MKFLLDTNVVSELINNNPEEAVIQWLSDVPRNHLYISSITLGEINMGIGKLPDGKKKSNLIIWFDKIQESSRYKTLPIDSEIALKWGEMLARSIKSGKTLPTIDCLIAATAYIHSAILVTRNTKDFQSIPIQLLNPWL